MAGNYLSPGGRGFGIFGLCHKNFHNPSIRLCSSLRILLPPVGSQFSPLYSVSNEILKPTLLPS